MEQISSGKIYGYGRISTEQDLNLQIQSLLENGIDVKNIYTDNSNTKHKQALKELLSLVTKGDTIVVKKLGRFGNSFSQVTDLIGDLTDKGVYIKSLDEGIDTSVNSPINVALLQLLPMFSEMEKVFITERTKPAIEEARKKGVKFGRPKASKEIYEMAVKDYIAGGISSKELIAKYGKDSSGKYIITEATLYRRIKEYKKQLEEQG